jgi:mRNA interferase MazF
MIPIEQYSLFWVDLNPTHGAEVNKKRPCVVISPDEMNRYLKTVIVAPLTNTAREYPFRFEVEVNGVTGWIMLDQIRAVDKTRIANHIGSLNLEDIMKIKELLQEMFVY